ncbi:hypothetical protein E8A73_037890 [Polyangium aurulentum]|nr:hypothetical protein E8A73_037890 [Polyangium aurulentum]
MKGAQNLGLTETALREWVRAAEANVGEKPPEALTGAEREELLRLRREVERLQMERESVKKRRAPCARSRSPRWQLFGQGAHYDPRSPAPIGRDFRRGRGPLWGRPAKERFAPSPWSSPVFVQPDFRPVFRAKSCIVHWGPRLPAASTWQHCVARI